MIVQVLEQVPVAMELPLEPGAFLRGESLSRLLGRSFCVTHVLNGTGQCFRPRHEPSIACVTSATRQELVAARRSALTELDDTALDEIERVPMMRPLGHGSFAS
jgi:hypothetical protein